MTATTRLPPTKVRVESCPECPFRGNVFEPSELQLVELEETTNNKCQHPGGNERDVTDEEGIPDFCPLIRAPLLVQLAKEPS